MIRKALVTLIISSVAVFVLPSVIGSERMASFMIQAGYEEACDVVIHEIPAQSTGYIAGMPFNIEEDIVSFSDTDVGRRIATIDIISNTRFKLTITSDGPMVHVDANKTTTDPLHYILTFQFLLGFYEGGYINESATTSIVHRSRNNTPTEWTIGVNPDPDTFLGTVDGAIYFMFDQTASEFIDSSDDTSLPPGNYESKVVIKVEALE